MVGSCLSNMASEYFYLKSCRKHRFPEASIYSDSSTLCSFQVGWILCAIMENKNHIYTEITFCCYYYDYEKKIHPNSPPTKKNSSKNSDLEGEWQKIIVVLFHVQKMNTSMLNVMEQPASVISLEESDELNWLRVKRMQNK